LGQFLLGDVFTKMAAMAPPALKGARRQRSLGVVLGFNVHVATQEKSIEMWQKSTQIENPWTES
jgi:hypothetical protein